MTTPDDKSTTVVATEAQTDIVHTQETKHKSSNAASSQQQLINLAKNFSLDGGLLPEEKQMPIAERAIRRERLVLLKQQQNLENIITKAISYCNDENAVNKTDHDWFTSFIPLAENISNKTMQGLWAKILAGEISRPGTFSLKALKVFRNMSIYDAKLFGKACSLACHSTNTKHYRIFVGSAQQPSLFNLFDKQRQQVINLNNFGLSFGDILSLAENHLIFNQESETHLFNKNGSLAMDFNGIPLIFTATKENCVLSFYKFTQAGTELARLINDAPEMDYLQSLKTQLSHHFSIQSKESSG